MKNIHASIRFIAKSESAAQILRDQIQKFLKQLDPDQVEQVEWDVQEETVFTRREIGTEDEVIAGLSFDEIFVPKSRSF